MSKLKFYDGVDWVEPIPASHNHNATDIIEDTNNNFVTSSEKTQITTNATNITGLIQNVTDISQIDSTVPITSASWVDDTGTSGYWYYDITDAEINANTVVEVNLSLTDVETTAKDAKVKSVCESFAGYARIYAETQPAGDMTATVVKTRQVI